MDVALYKRHALAVSPVLDRVSIINNWSNDDIVDDKRMYIGNNSSMVKSVNVVERTSTPERQIIIVNNYHHRPIDFILNGTQMVANAKKTSLDKLIQMTPASSPIPSATSSSSSSSSSLSSVGAIPATSLSPSSSVHNHLLHRSHLSTSLSPTIS